MEKSIITLISKQPLLKCLLWRRTSASIGCYGGSGKCLTEAPHFIHDPKTPFICKHQTDNIPEIRPSTDLTTHPNPWQSLYATRNPLGLYSTCLLYNAQCTSGKCSFPFYETLHGEPRPPFLNQPTMGSSGVTDLEDLPAYSLVPRPKPKKWWESFCKWSWCETEEEVEPCGEPISLTPDQVEGEVLRLETIHHQPRYCHPLVERIGRRTSFSPKDIPEPFTPEARYYDEKPIPPPQRLTFFEALFYREPKTEIVYPKTYPRAKVMSFQEVCLSISNSLLTPPRFECSTRDPQLVFTGVPAPYFSQCPTWGPGPCSPPFPGTVPPPSKPSPPVATCASETVKVSPPQPWPPRIAPPPPKRTPCPPKKQASSVTCRTCVSPSLEKKQPTVTPLPIVPGPQIYPGVQPVMPTPMVAMPATCPPVSPVPVSPPPPRMVCGGKTPLDDMPAPFYSECREPDESLSQSEPCYEESTEKPCNINRCKRRDFDSEADEIFYIDGVPQPFYSQCPPRELKKYEEADKDT